MKQKKKRNATNSTLLSFFITAADRNRTVSANPLFIRLSRLNTLSKSQKGTKRGRPISSQPNPEQLQISGTPALPRSDTSKVAFRYLCADALPYGPARSLFLPLGHDIPHGFFVISFRITSSSSIFFCCSSVRIEPRTVLQANIMVLAVLLSISPFRAILATLASVLLISVGVFIRKRVGIPFTSSIVHRNKGTVIIFIKIPGKKRF